MKSTSNEKADKIDGDDNTSPVSKSGDVKKATKSISEGKTGQSNDDVNNDKVKDNNADDSITVDVSKIEKIEGRANFWPLDPHRAGFSKSGTAKKYSKNL